MSLNRREFLRTSTAAAALGPVAGALTSSRARAGDDPSGRGPNLLFILADQWRGSALGVGSDEVVRTPHIDRLTEQGTHFPRAYAANPVCTPNRSCLLTGRYSHQTGMITNNLMLPPEEVCWPEVFRDAGYATHYIGKWHMDGNEKPGFVPPGWRRRGFETFEGFNRGHVYHRPWGFDDEGGPLIDKWNDDGSPYYEPTFQTDLAIDYMRKHQDRPFACYLSWGPPHTPFKPPQDFDRYAAADIRLRDNVPPAHRQKARRELAGYYGLCESLDHEMGRLLAFLDTSGLADNTLLVFTADHGELAGSHGKYRKGEPEDESLRVPLIMRLPGTVAAGQTSPTLVNSIDLMPTMLQLCGFDAPESCVGRNLATAATGSGTPPSAGSIYCEGKVNRVSAPERLRNPDRSDTTGAWRSLVTERYKHTVRHGADNVVQLIDLHNEPLEMENHANARSHAAIQKELLAELHRWANRTGDSWPDPPEAARAMYSDREAEMARG
ncbi:MAG: sulfatase [Maioricimonas sp. JB049]